MSIRSIRSEADYRAALGDAGELMKSDPAPGTPDGNRLDAMVSLLQLYEARHFPVTGTEVDAPWEAGQTAQ